ncbi:MAG: hypothetical protein QM770_19360 [Tepidisphaeraceae bacterium]
MRSANPFKAGLFILISLALAIAIFFGIAGSSWALGPTRDYVADFTLGDDVSGMTDGNDVRIGGVKVGAVRGVEIVDIESGTPKVRVRFRIPARYELKDGASVNVQTGLTGLVNLNIASLGSGKAIAPETPIAGIGSPLNRAIASLGEASPTIAAVVADVRTTTLPKVNAAFDSASGALDKGKEAGEQIRVAAASADQTIQHIKSKIDPAVERYNNVADKAKSALTHVDDLLGDGKTDLRTTIANLRKVTDTLDAKLGPIADKVASAVDSVKGAVDETRTMLTDVKSTIDNTRDATGNIRSILTTNRSRIDEIIKSLNTTSSNLGFASGEIRRSPWRLLYKPDEGEVANQNLYDTARQFAEGANKLQDSAAALRDMLNDPKADAEKVRALLLELDASSKKFSEVEATLWQQVRK